MAITTDMINDFPVISIGEEHDLEFNSEFYNILNTYINDRKKKKFVIDITKLQNIHSTGIGVIVKTAIRLEELNGKAVVASVNDRIKQLFILANITDLVTIKNSVHEAIFLLENY